MGTWVHFVEWIKNTIFLLSLIHKESPISSGRKHWHRPKKCLFGIGDPMSHIMRRSVAILLYLQGFCKKLKLVRSIGPGKSADF